MDNITANKVPWFQEDIKVEKKKVKEELPKVKANPKIKNNSEYPDISEINVALDKLTNYYTNKADKRIGDLIVHLEIANRMYHQLLEN